MSVLFLITGKVNQTIRGGTDKMPKKPQAQLNFSEQKMRNHLFIKPSTN